MFADAELSSHNKDKMSFSLWFFLSVLISYFIFQLAETKGIKR